MKSPKEHVLIVMKWATLLTFAIESRNVTKSQNTYMYLIACLNYEQINNYSSKSSIRSR
jgi:hypothetical protein